MRIYKARLVCPQETVVIDRGFSKTPNWNILNAAKMIWIINLYFVILGE